MDNTIEILCTDSNGVYIPQMMVGWLVEHGWQGINPTDVAIIEEGPEGEQYWHAWECVLINARFKSEDGKEWTLHQNGDLFAVREDFEWSEDF